MAGPPRSAAWRVGVASLVFVWLAQVSIPLLDHGERALSTTLVVVFLTTATACFVMAARGIGRAAVAVVLVSALGLLVEFIGIRTGRPFGRYEYTDALRPQVFGVPVVVVLAWAAMGLPAWAVACRLVRRPSAQICVGAVALMGWDLFLDPQMVREGYWTWPGGGAYRGIPLSNFAGWLLVALVVMGVLHLVVPSLGSTALAGAYLLMSVMEVVGFGVFFSDPLVAAVGGLVCLPLAVVAVFRRANG